MFKSASAYGHFIDLNRLYLLSEQVTKCLRTGYSTATQEWDSRENDVIHHSEENLLLIKSPWNIYGEKKNPQQGSLVQT